MASHGNQLIMLGTGYGTATRLYNSCFVLRTGRFTLLTDGGGGNEVLRRLSATGIAISDLDAIFVTHCHTDHILGVVWVLRMIAENNLIMAAGKPKLRLYGNSKVIATLTAVCRATLSAGTWQRVCGNVELKCVASGQRVLETGDVELTFFDTLDAHEPQFGFRATLPGGTTVACLGDAACKEALRGYVQGSSWLLCEAFCLSSDEATFHAAEFHHSTVSHTARMAQSMAVKNLVIYHTEDVTPQRKARYAAEAQTEFHGHVHVPDDMETITL